MEWRKYADWRKALNQIRDFSYEYDPTLVDKSDTEMLVLAQNLSERLNFWVLRIAEVELESEDIIEKLSAGWKLHKRVIYHFSTDKKTWLNARNFCRATKSDLATINTAEEQTYIDEQSKKVAEPYWICLKRNASFPHQVKWCLRNTNATRTYWNINEPNGRFGDCVASVPTCNVHQCWDDLPCSTQLRYLCKKRPDPKFD
ncbi:C-type lectin domain family 4 member K-like isoform X5 [Sceloporus undulatus]|nr:C-type lectin domain family 4 member K-like isoform X5 [Sceloporus undulatus]